MGAITASRTTLKPDPRYQSILASKFINCLMWDGKKTVAQQVFYDALDVIKERIPDADPIEVFSQAIENVKPHIEVEGDRAHGSWDILAPCTANDGTPMWMAGVEDDQYVRENGVWLHQSMKLRLIFMAPHARGWSKAQPAS